MGVVTRQWRSRKSSSSSSSAPPTLRTYFYFYFSLLFIILSADPASSPFVYLSLLGGSFIRFGIWFLVRVWFGLHRTKLIPQVFNVCFGTCCGYLCNS